MTALNTPEGLALLVASLVLMTTGALLALLGALASAGVSGSRSRGVVVLLLGPVPVVVKGGARTALVAFLLAAAALVLFLYLLLA